MIAMAFFRRCTCRHNRLLRNWGNLAFLVALFASGCKQHSDQSPQKEELIDISSLKETSVNLELSDLQPVLDRVSKLVADLPSAVTDRILHDVNGMSVKGQRDWSLNVTYDGRKVPLVIRVFMDDQNSPDTYFFTVPDLAKQIDDIITKYMEALGR